jgi:hypothetical protein
MPSSARVTVPADPVPQAIDTAAVRYSRDMSYFDRSSNTLVAHNPKCASTSLFVRALRAEGIDPELAMERAAYAGVDWDEGIWEAVPRLSNIWRNLSPADQLAALNPARVRMVAIVRDPRDRLWSAWVSKVLGGGMFYDMAYGHETSLLQAGLASVNSVADLMDPFAHFVGMLTNGHSILADPHFIPQATLLSWTHTACEFVPLSRADEVIGHIGPARPGSGSQRANVGALNIPRPAFPPSIAAQIDAIYARDDAVFAHVFADETSGGAENPRPSDVPFDARAFAARVRLGRRLANVERAGFRDLGGVSVRVQIRRRSAGGRSRPST